MLEWTGEVEFHQACILDANGETICQRRIEHSGAGMLEFCDFLQALTMAKRLHSRLPSKFHADRW